MIFFVKTRYLWISSDQLEEWVNFTKFSTQFSFSITFGSQRLTKRSNDLITPVDSPTLNWYSLNWWCYKGTCYWCFFLLVLIGIHSFSAWRGLITTSTVTDTNDTWWHNREWKINLSRIVRIATNNPNWTILVWIESRDLYLSNDAQITKFKSIHG